MVSPLAILLAVSVLVVAACSSTTARPVEFDRMAPDEVGCTIMYGDGAPYIVGPLGTGDTQDLKPNDWTLFHLGRTALEIYFSIETDRSGQNGSRALNNLPADGVVASEGFIDSGNPGYTITCWRGDADNSTESQAGAARDARENELR